MPLTYNFTKMFDGDEQERIAFIFETYDPDAEQGQYYNYVSEVIWGTMHVGMNRITEDNYKEFYRRLRMLCLAEGHVKHPTVTLEIVKNFIGLSTNASPLTDAAFFKTLRVRLNEWANSQVWVEERKAKESE